MTTYATETKMGIEQRLKKTAIRSGLSADEEKRVLAGLGYLGAVADSVEFTIDNGTSIVHRNFNIRVPEETKRVFAYLGDWNINFGNLTQINERPLGWMYISYGITGFDSDNTGPFVGIQVHAVLRDVNGDDPWAVYVEIVTACFG